MARDAKQIHLSAPECSGRGVRYRSLKPAERDACLLVAAKLVGAAGSQIDVTVMALREGVKRMLVSVTTKGDLAPEEVATATWTTLDAATLELPGPMSFDELFTGKDDAILSAIYRRLHEPSGAEFEAIMGKALPVSTG